MATKHDSRLRHFSGFGEVEALPSRVLYRCRAFLSVTERIDWLLRHDRKQGTKLWAALIAVAQPTAIELDAHLQAIGDSVYEHPGLLRLVVHALNRDNEDIVSIKNKHIHLEDALRRRLDGSATIKVEESIAVLLSVRGCLDPLDFCASQQLAKANNWRDVLMALSDEKPDDQHQSQGQSNPMNLERPRSRASSSPVVVAAAIARSIDTDILLAEGRRKGFTADGEDEDDDDDDDLHIGADAAILQYRFSVAPSSLNSDPAPSSTMQTVCKPTIQYSQSGQDNGFLDNAARGATYENLIASEDANLTKTKASEQLTMVQAFTVIDDGEEDDDVDDVIASCARLLKEVGSHENEHSPVKVPGSAQMVVETDDGDDDGGHASDEDDGEDDIDVDRILEVSAKFTHCAGPVLPTVSPRAIVEDRIPQVSREPGTDEHSASVATVNSALGQRHDHEQEQFVCEGEDDGDHIAVSSNIIPSLRTSSLREPQEIKTKASTQARSRSRPRSTQCSGSRTASTRSVTPRITAATTARRKPTPKPAASEPHTHTKCKKKPLKTSRVPSSSSNVASAATTASWREVEEWKNVDMILTRKRRIVTHGQVEGSEVPWGEEFAAIQSLKRFAVQYPDVLRDHIECQLHEVITTNSGNASGVRPGTSATSAAREALLLIKDLAFLLRLRLGPFLDVILPVVLPAIFHAQKRFLCNTAYDVLEALVAHCSGQRLILALLRQALRSPREDMRIINLTCLYIEKCANTMSVASLQELMARSAASVLESTATLLTCKSAACQIALQKTLLLLQDAIHEAPMRRVMESHLAGNALTVVQRHLAQGESVRRGTGSPSKNSTNPTTTPRKHGGNSRSTSAAVDVNTSNGGRSILQRMLSQRQHNRVVPAPE